MPFRAESLRDIKILYRNHADAEAGSGEGSSIE